MTLAERCETERATSDLNAEIWLETRINFSQRSFNHWQRLQPKGSNPSEREYALDRAPNFTGSIDTAQALVPAGFVWTLSRLAGGGYWASVADPHEEDGFPTQLPVATPALALCAAALYARIQRTTGDNQ